MRTSDTVLFVMLFFFILAVAGMLMILQIDAGRRALSACPATEAIGEEP